LDDHIKRRHVNELGATKQDKSSTLPPSKIVLRETATSPMIPKGENMSKTTTSQFNIEDKENQENQRNQANQIRQKQTMKEEKGVETEGLYPINPQNNIVYAAATSTQDDGMAFEKVQGILKKFKEEDDEKINSLNQSINEKINQIMSVNNETVRKVNDLEHKVEAYQLTASRISRSQLIDLSHEEHHHEDRNLINNDSVEVPASQRTTEEEQNIFKKSPMKMAEGPQRYREQADYLGSGDVLEPHEEEEEVIEREEVGDLNIVELEEVHDEGKEQEQEKENKPVAVETQEAEDHFTQEKRDRIAAYNRLYHIDQQEEEPVEAVEPVKEAEDVTEEVIRQEFNAGEMEDDLSERRNEPKKNEKIRIEDQEEIDENKSIPLRKKTPSYPVASSNYRERQVEREDIQELEEEHHEEELPYEDEDERERTMRVIESSMGIRGDEDQQIERDRKEYLKARETMDQKYLAEMMQPVDVEKAQEDIKGDLKHSFKNMFGSDFDLLAGKDMVIVIFEG